MIATNFGGSSFDFAMDDALTDYAPMAGAMGQVFGKLGAQRSEPEVVAGVIWDAAHATDDTLRYRAGADAVEMLDRRKAQDDSTFIGGILREAPRDRQRSARKLGKGAVLASVVFVCFLYWIYRFDI